MRLGPSASKISFAVRDRRFQGLGSVRFQRLDEEWFVRSTGAPRFLGSLKNAFVQIALCFNRRPGVYAGASLRLRSVGVLPGRGLRALHFHFTEIQAAYSERLRIDSP